MMTWILKSLFSYWFIKRKIRNIKFRLSLRDAHGKKIYYFKDIITYTKVFNYSVKNILKKLIIRQANLILLGLLN